MGNLLICKGNHFLDITQPERHCGYFQFDAYMQTIFLEYSKI